MAKLLSRFLGMTILCFMLSGCGVIDYFYLPVPEDTAQELFEAGNEAMSEKDYASAAGYYTKLKENFPFSPYAIEAELSLADCYFLDEEWGPAVDAYKEFEGLHPRHEAMPYVLFNIGMANLNGYPSIDRPPNQIEEAYSYFNRVQEIYGDTEYAEVSRQKMAECRKLMAEHELYVGDFYFRMGRYGSALARYQDILKRFSDVPEVYKHTEEKAKVAFIKDRETKSEQTRREREGSWRDYFNWL